MTNKRAELDLDRAQMSHIWLFLVTFVFVFYGMGASFVESFVNYPTWRFIGAAEFRAYHQALSPLIIGYMVIPMGICILLTMALVWKRPAAIPKWMIWSALILQFIGALSSVFIQIPIQVRLNNEGLSLPLIDQLIISNLWLRRIPLLINSILFFWMMTLLLKLQYRSDRTNVQNVEELIHK
jgi:hypothetical protein